MTKEQLIDLILTYEKEYQIPEAILDTYGVILQDKIKDNFWYLFSGQYDIFLERALVQMFGYELSCILKYVIFGEKFDNLPLYLNPDLEDIYKKVLFKEQPNMVVGSQVAIKRKMIVVTAAWRLKNNINKGDSDVY